MKCSTCVSLNLTSSMTVLLLSRDQTTNSLLYYNPAGTFTNGGTDKSVYICTNSHITIGPKDPNFP